jgi:hypothetical protein
VSRSTTIWAVDLAGAQHDQHIPVVSFAEYVKVYVAEIVETRPFGTNAKNVKAPVTAQNPSHSAVATDLENILDHSVDELTEWEHHNVTVQALLKAQGEAYQFLKAKLVKHLVRETREYVKLTQNDSTSRAKPIVVTNHELENMSDEGKARMERKKARMIAGMDAETRALWDGQQAKASG